MDPNQILINLGRHFGLGELQFDERGVCALEFDERFVVTLELDPSGATLHLYCALGEAPEGLLDRLSCFAALLESNLFGQGTGGASLCYDSDNEALLICKVLVPKHLTLEALQESFELFVRAADSWHERVQARFWKDEDGDREHDRPLGPGPFMRV